MSEESVATRGMTRALSLAAGPLAYALLSLFASTSLPREAAHVLGIAAWMMIWWLTGPVPLGATALLPLVLFPVLGVASAREAAAPYANELVFLFLAGFLLAAALEYWNAHARIAYGIVDVIGTASARRVVLGVMLATGFISLWISNTATTAMMYPIALAVGALFGDSVAGRNLRTALLLGIAYAASIGGMGTLIGTPPNLIFAGAARELAGYEVGFVQFMTVGVPIVALLLPICWALLMLLFPGTVEFTAEARVMLHEKRAALGKLRGGEGVALTVFALTALAWFFREPKELGGIRVPGLTDVARGITDTTVGVAGAVALFVLSGVTRDGERRAILTWREARGIPWEVLLIFGGGFSLATAIETSGLAKWLGSLITGLAGYPTIVIYGGIALIVLVLTELASNTAVATMAMPIVASLASTMGQPRLALMLLAALVASCGFALPMATAPNIIVFGSGHITVRQMARAGLALDLIATALVVLAVTVLYPAVFG